MNTYRISIVDQLTLSYAHILDLANSSSDNYDAAYVNNDAENSNTPGIYNKDVHENPYYETATNLEITKESESKTKAVNLNDTEVVTASKNIYYD